MNMKRIVLTVLVGMSAECMYGKTSSSASTFKENTISIELLEKNIKSPQKGKSASQKKAIVGKWLNQGFIYCIYKQRNKYYIGMIDGNTDAISELYEVVRVSATRYENRDNGDMPERFNIQNNGDIMSYVYNPDAPSRNKWVYMGTWVRLKNR
jgi:hypothetical protein